MKKEFVFSVKFDTTEFDKSVESIKSKLQGAMTPANMATMAGNTGNRLNQAGFGGLLSVPSMEAYQRATQASRREMDQLIQEQARGQEKLGKIIAQRAETLKKLQDQQKQMVKDSKEELELKEKISRVEANNARLRENYRQRDRILNESLDAREAMKPQGMQRILGAMGGGGGIRGGGRELASMAMENPVGAFNILGKVLGGVGTAINMGAGIYEHFGRSPFRTNINTGSAIEGTVGRSINDMGSAYGQAWGTERIRALSGAGRMDEVSRRADIARLIGGSALISGGASAFGAGAAASATGVGALAGVPAMVGGIGTMIGGGYSMLGTERGRALAGSTFMSGMGGMINEGLGGGFGIGNWMKSKGDAQMKEYNSILAKEFAENFQSALAAEQQMSPLKKLAAQSYDQNYGNYLQTQRSLGLDFSTFHAGGGFRERAINAGFTDQMAMGMSGDILSAGGSTRMGRDSVLGLQLQRQMGLTNAGQILGTLSGGLGSSEASKQATIKILSEGMRLGLDDSKFAEENRKFVQMTAEIVARSGARTESDFDRVAGGFSKFVGENTTMGLSAAKSAYEQYQQVSATTTGPRGVMRAAGFLSDPTLSKLSTMSKQALMQVPESDLNSTNPLVQNAAKEANTTPEDIIQRISGVNQQGVSRFAESDKLRDKLKAYAQKIGKTNLTEQDIAAAPKDVQDDFNKMATLNAVQFPWQGNRETTAFNLGLINGPGSEKQKLANENLINDRMNRDTGRIEDDTVKNLAESSRLALDSFNQFHKEIVPTVESIKNFNTAIKASVEAMKNMSPNNANTFNNQISNILGVPGAVQPQAGSEQK